MTPQKILAIDYGTKRIGLAINYLSLAEPYGIIQHSETMMADLQAIIEKEQVDQLIIGVSDREMAEASRQFGNSVHAATSVPVEFVDESYTSKNVEEKLRSGGAKLSTRMGPIDHFAAAEMLQEWLDTRR